MLTTSFGAEAALAVVLMAPVVVVVVFMFRSRRPEPKMELMMELIDKASVSKPQPATSEASLGGLGPEDVRGPFGHSSFTLLS